MVLRLVIFISILIGIDFYGYQAIKTITKNPYIHVIYWILSVGVLGYLLYSIINYDRSVGPTKESLRAAGIFLLFFTPKIVLLVFMFGEDIIRVLAGGYHYLSDHFFDVGTEKYMPERRKFISQLAFGLAAIPFASFIYGMFIGKYNFRVISHTIYFDDLPEAFDDFQITQISDIHSGSFDDISKIEYAIDLINEQDSDMIVFTGDIVNTKAEEMDPYMDTFKRIHNPEYGKYSILGNHDYGEYVTWPSEVEKTANFDAIKGIHKNIDFNLLLNECVYIEKDGDRIALIGVENWGHNFKKAGDLSKASERISEDDFKILLSHDPSHWEKEVKDHPTHYHLTLSGHTHGFQFGIEIPGVFKWSPVQYVYKQWAGLYEEFGKYVNVNRGFGFHAYPGRVGIWPEITVIKLKKRPINA
jgi:predicted MPP superfamily phosphohydrolase